MAEEQINEIEVKLEDLSGIDCGGGYRKVRAEIFIDNTLPRVRQIESAIHEILGLYIGNVVETGTITEIAVSLAQAIEEIE